MVASESASESERLEAARAFLRARGIEVPKVVVVLGSGLQSFAERLQGAATLPCSEVPGWPAPRVAGHGGALLTGRLGDTAVACLSGRVHLYEGWSAHEVVRAVRTLRLCGGERFLLTNAAGGLARSFAPGDLMVLTDHLNLTGQNPMAGPHQPLLGPRFPDLTQVYDQKLQAALLAADQDLQRGVYAALRGPTYETPAEVKMLAVLGADAVGMSTVLEAIALHAMGARVAGLSLISNAAAGIGPTPLSHDEVIAAGKAAERRIVGLLERVLPAMARA